MSVLSVTDDRFGQVDIFKIQIINPAWLAYSGDVIKAGEFDAGHG
jgi:hypothetical protein